MAARDWRGGSSSSVSLSSEAVEAELGSGSVEADGVGAEGVEEIFRVFRV
eukprot:CAMPEP_0173255078 /NCGR_PEP_ID=MMETSP1142-20121109/22310_1 /TAXON_ID=483371 /ORGANISM="non described non described, Strain CCMP2298" /LENGTH=49 /DNA_ID= /DNA_START= /DNA_END= /DNA_ORIENTATION=